MYHIFFIHSSVDGHVGCLHVLAIVSSAAVNTGVLLSHKKEWNSAICSHMDGPRDCHTEWSKSDREGQVSYDIAYMQNLKKNDTNELKFTKQKYIHRLTERTYGYQGGRVRGRDS